MALILDPDRVLSFERSLTHAGKQNVILKNTTGAVVAFKVKTTAPNVYSVRPNVGFIGPLGTKQILVYRQPQSVEPKICKDKFLILSIPVNDPNIKTVEEIHAMWTNVEHNNKKNISQAKLQCQLVDTQNAIDLQPREEQQTAISLPEPQTVLDTHREPEIDAVSLPSVSLPSILVRVPTNPQPMAPQLTPPQPTEPLSLPPPPLREPSANPISPPLSSQPVLPLPQAPANNEQINELNETIHRLKAQLSVYKDEVSSLRQRRSEPRPNPQPVVSNRVQPIDTRYPTSALVIVALFAFALGYLVIRATS